MDVRAEEVADTKFKHGARNLFKKGISRQVADDELL
jgi:hypothetical protein